ncbi:hypothetical protein GH714_007152 [Hevea brasiliensis]|uniref:Uncharacterized protein n=1 Tax=Hevea brasiliensis TaxID=3981 RepID=A0A6A6MCH9_HEVBR|nr:hypothetical protein GH714_007152 [Hevea brasiliensis]
MGILEKLRNLRFLQLNHSYEGSKMVCSAHGFPQLETLIFASLCELEEWEIEEGAMPYLMTLQLMNLNYLMMIPEGLKSVTAIQELKICGIRGELKNRVQVTDGVEGEDFDKGAGWMVRDDNGAVLYACQLQMDGLRDPKVA